MPDVLPDVKAFVNISVDEKDPEKKIISLNISDKLTVSKVLSIFLRTTLAVGGKKIGNIPSIYKLYDEWLARSVLHISKLFDKFPKIAQYHSPSVASALGFCRLMLLASTNLRLAAIEGRHRAVALCNVMTGYRCITGEQVMLGLRPLVSFRTLDLYHKNTLEETDLYNSIFKSGSSLFTSMNHQGPKSIYIPENNFMEDFIFEARNQSETSDHDQNLKGDVYFAEL